MLVEGRTRWIEAEADPGATEGLMTALGIPHRLSRLLVIRGISDADEAHHFLEPRLTDLPDPAQMADMDRAARRLADAIASQESVAIYGDYDVDGVTSASLMVRFLEMCGADATVFVPDRFVDGYGVSARRVEELVASGATLMVTVDCGTAHREAVARAQENGCDVIVVDHHHVPEDRARPHALLNPVRDDCDFGFTRLAAVGVAFFLCVATRRELRARRAFGEGRPEPDLRELLELAALGTVADVMPLVSVNRILVAAGLSCMNRRPSVGMAALVAASGIDGRPVGSSDLGFRLGPRINAAGRMTHARGGLEMLTGHDAERARQLASALNRENQARRDTEKTVLESALEQARVAVERGCFGLVVYQPDWHLGVVGIVAARVREAFSRPTFVLGRHPDDGRAKGSGRSVGGFDLVGALDACASQLEQYGGHAHAAGVTLAADGVGRFAEHFDAVARERLDSDDLVPRLRIDDEIALDEVGLPLLDATSRLAPFGKANPRPVFCLRGVRASSWRRVGQDGAHLQLRFPSGYGEVKGIAFGMGERAGLLEDAVDVAFALDEDTWGGGRRVQMKVKDLRLAE